MSLNKCLTVSNFRVVQRCSVRLNDIEYWACELEPFDGQRVLVVPSEDKKTAQVFRDGKLICDKACIQASMPCHSWANISTERLAQRAQELQERLDNLGNDAVYTPQQRHVDAMKAEVNRRLKRRVMRGSVRIDGVDYSSPQLEALEGTEVDIVTQATGADSEGFLVQDCDGNKLKILQFPPQGSPQK